MADYLAPPATLCLGCDKPIPKPAADPDAILCLSCLQLLDEMELEPAAGPAAPLGAGPDAEGWPEETAL